MSSDIEAFEATVKNDYVFSLTDFLSEFPNMKSKHEDQDHLQLIDQSVPPFRSIRDEVKARLEEIEVSGDMRAKAKSWKLRRHLLFLDRSLKKIEQVRRDCSKDHNGVGTDQAIQGEDRQQDADGEGSVAAAAAAAAAALQREDNDTPHNSTRQGFPVNEVHVKKGDGGVISVTSSNTDSPDAAFEDDAFAGHNSIDGSKLGSDEEEDEEAAPTSVYDRSPPKPLKPPTPNIHRPRKKKKRHIAICGKCQESAFKVSEAWILVPESVKEHGKEKADGKVPTHLTMHLICTDCRPRNGDEFLNPKEVVGGLSDNDEMSRYVYSMASRIEYERALNGGKSLYGPAGQEYVPPNEYMI